MLITLQQIRDKSPCADGWAKLLKSCGNPADLSIQVSFGDIAKSNGALDALWCLRCINDRKFGVSLILPTVKRAAKHTDDQRVHGCIAVLDRVVSGESVRKIQLYNAYAAAYAAVRTAAYASAASAASFAAAYAYASAASAASFAAVWASATSADEKQQQIHDIIALSPLHTLKSKAN